MSTISVATEPSLTLGEGPSWDPARQRVVWVDIEEGLVLVGRLDDGQLRVETRHDFDGYVGAAVLAEDGSLVVAETSSLTRVAHDGRRTDLGRVEPLGQHDRLNDAICDSRGRILVGTLSLEGESPRTQRLLQIDLDGRTAVLDDDLGLANGLAFSPDGCTLYSIDSTPGTVWRRDYDQLSGSTGERSVLVDLTGETPDGMAVDGCGDLWVAMWGLGEVRRYTTEGDLVEVISVPAPHTTSVAFVGPALDELLITTARSGLSEDDLVAHPLSGSVFIAKASCRGLAPYVAPVQNRR